MSGKKGVSSRVKHESPLMTKKWWIPTTADGLYASEVYEMKGDGQPTTDRLDWALKFVAEAKCAAWCQEHWGFSPKEIPLSHVAVQAASGGDHRMKRPDYLFDQKDYFERLPK